MRRLRSSAFALVSSKGHYRFAWAGVKIADRDCNDRVFPAVGRCMTPIPKLIRRRSGIAGWGVFAAGSIEKDARIVEYKGELVPIAEGLRRQDRYARRGRLWTFVVNTRWLRDAAVGGNIARYINHACRPNCYSDVVGRTIWILASRRIRAGEELTYDYNSDGFCGIRCKCRSGCRRVL